jgi:succinylglutamate desuccinylase
MEISLDALENIILLGGATKSPASIILAGVHGNEKCGVETIEHLLPCLNIEKGQVLIGCGNPKAIKANKRFMEANLNRLFVDETLLSKNEKESYEYCRATTLKTYLNQADVLLDIHASTTPNSIPFIIAESNAKVISDYLPVSIILSGFDKIQPGGTDYYMNRQGKIGICVECGFLSALESSQIAQKVLISFLKARGHINNDLSKTNQKHGRVYYCHKCKTDNFTLVKPFVDFESVFQNQLIGIDGEFEVRTPGDGFILFPTNALKRGSEVFLLGKFMT